MRAAALVASLGLPGCYVYPPCGTPRELRVRDGEYSEVLAGGTATTTTAGTTPFEQPDVPPVAGLTVAGDVVVLTYEDAEGREIEVTYDVVERSR